MISKTARLLGVSLLLNLLNLCLSPVSLAASPWRGQVGNHRLEISPQGIVQTHPTQRNLLPLLKSMGDEEMACEAERQVKLKSWVGTLVSFEQADQWNCVATAHPGAYSQVLTYNLATQKPLQLTAIFADQQVLKALLADKLVKKHLPAKLPRFASSQALINHLAQTGTGECAYTFAEDSLSHFYIHHLKGNQAAVRIGLSHGCEAARGSLTEIGIYLPVPQAWQKSMQQAAKGQAGFVASNNPISKVIVQQQLKDPGYDAALAKFLAEH